MNASGQTRASTTHRTRHTHHLHHLHPHPGHLLPFRSGFRSAHSRSRSSPAPPLPLSAVPRPSVRPQVPIVAFTSHAGSPRAAPIPTALVEDGAVTRSHTRPSAEDGGGRGGTHPRTRLRHRCRPGASVVVI